PVDPGHVLHDDRLIEPELLLDLQLLRRVHHAGAVEQDVDDVARHQPQQHEDHHRDAEQGEQHQAEPPDQVASHLEHSAHTTPHPTLSQRGRVCSSPPPPGKGQGGGTSREHHLSSHTSSNRYPL